MTSQVIKKAINTTEELHKVLSIQFSLDGFSFCIKNLTTNFIEHFIEVPFDKKVENPENLAEKLELLFKENKILQQDFFTVEAIHNNPLSTLVPTKYFEESKLKAYLNFTIKTFASDFIAFDDLQQTETKNVYIPYVNLNNFLFQHFGSFEYKHHSTILIDKLLFYSKDKEYSFYVCVNHQQLDIIVIKNTKLLFYNSFQFHTKEDGIYYILFTAEQLKLNPDEFTLLFIGDITKNSDLYSITYQYVRNIEFSTIKNSSNHAKFLLT